MRNKKGITLIALVITIIVLLILAGVSISMISGDDGIVNKASSAKEKTRASTIIDKIGLTVSENQIAESLGETVVTKEELIQEFLEEGLLTTEEVATLDNKDEITIEGMVIDFSKLKDDGFDYIGRKYLLGV